MTCDILRDFLRRPALIIALKQAGTVVIPCQPPDNWLTISVVSIGLAFVAKMRSISRHVPVRGVYVHAREPPRGMTAVLAVDACGACGAIGGSTKRATNRCNQFMR